MTSALNIEMAEPWHRDGLLSWQASNPDTLESVRRVAETYGKSGTLEVTAALCALLDLIGNLTAERDRARSIANAPEQELALKDEAIEQLRALHEPDDCDCGRPYCAEDGFIWPCKTARILDGLAARLDNDEKEQAQ